MQHASDCTSFSAHVGQKCKRSDTVETNGNVLSFCSSMIPKLVKRLQNVKCGVRTLIPRNLLCSEMQFESRVGQVGNYNKLHCE